MRTPRLILILSLLSLALHAQKYGNEWIRHTQQYFKFPLSKEGVYKIDSTTLSNYFNLSTVNPKNFQLFIKGKEQWLYVKGEADNKMNTGDYLEFFYEGRPGDVDSLIYHKITYLPNPYKALFNDTLYGYLTLNNSFANRHCVLETDTNSAAWPAANYFYYEKVWSPYNYYNRAVEFPENGANSVYTQNEGIGRVIIDNDGTLPGIDSLVYPCSSLNIFNANTNNKIYLTYSSAGEYRLNISFDHRLQLFYPDASGNQTMIQDTTFSGPTPLHQTFTFSPQSFGNAGNIIIRPSPSSLFPSYANIHTVFYTKLNYPHTLNLSGKAYYTLNVANQSGTGKYFYNFSNFNAGSNVELFDLSNGKYIQTVVNGNFVRAVIPDGPIDNKRCVLVRSDSVRTITNLKP
ncbi:MAG: hypothetical protein IT236_10330, partial [Bacteroidia bacterium]|nr:hypothetical protein [Bacteroidia bacterium]